MNYPPIFETCAADAGVVALLGESGGALRLYPAGSAPQGATKPYAVWQFIGGGPENYLAGRPDVDRFALQVDAYADTLTAARAIADAIEEAVELVAHVTAFRGEEKDLETALYRVGFDLEWFVNRAAPTPAPVSSEPAPVSSSQPAQEYPLDDDGTAAAAFGYGHAATNAPAYLRADYTYTDATAGGTAVATPTLAAMFAGQAVTVGAGQVVACEAVVHSAPAAFGGLGIAFADSSGGTPSGEAWTCGIKDDDGSTPVYYAAGASPATRTSASAGFRVGLSINGTTGEVRAHTTDGVLLSATAFTPGRAASFCLFVADGGDAPVNLGQTCSVELVPNAAAMALAYPTGAVDVFGNVI